MTPMIASNATFPTSLAEQHDGRYPAKDEWQLRRQCPSCMRVTGPARSACERCSLQFFQPVRTVEESLREIYIGIGAGAFLLASFIAATLQYL